MNRIHEVIQLAFSSFPFTVSVVLAALGLVSLLVGKKLFWLAVGINVFLISYILIRVMLYWNHWSELALAGGIGVVIALISIALKKFAVAINAFFIFGLLVAGVVNEEIEFDENSFVPLVVFFVTGSFAAVLTFIRLEMLSMVSSCAVGALALSIGVFKMLKISPDPLFIFLAWIGLALLGILFQSYLYRVPLEVLDETFEYDENLK